MTGRPVARVGDVTVTTSAATSYPNDAAATATGSWGAADVVPTPAAGAMSGEEAVLVGASCVFTFTGTTTSTPSTAFTSPPSTVTLTPGVRALRLAERSPLVNDDTSSDTFGNTLKVESTATWRTQ